MIEKYLKKFSKLKTYRSRKTWTDVTAFQAPHKPFLLLSVMDLIEQGQITTNFIAPSFELLDIFNGYWHAVMPHGTKTSMAYPFPRLRTDGFWHLIPNSGYESRIGIDFFSMVKLREFCAGAQMDEELFQFMCRPETREQLRAVLVNSYFAPEIRPTLIEQGQVNYEAYEYSQNLLKVAEAAEPFDVEEAETEKKKKARDQGFRKAVVTLYQHRCAMCGIPMLTPAGQ